MYSVLIVEDEMLVSIGLRNMISWFDMNLSIIGEARNGKQGLQMYQDRKPDIILTDIKMPVMDGLEMISEIRKTDTETKIIILSSYEDFVLVNQAYKLGISDYISKIQMMPEEIECVIRKIVQEVCETNRHRKRNPSYEQENKEEIARKKVLEYILNPSETQVSLCSFLERLQIGKNGFLICKMELEKDIKKKVGKVHGDKMIYAIESLIRNILKEQRGGDVWIEKADTYLLFLNMESEPCKENLKKIEDGLIRRIQIVIQSCMNMDTVWGVSSFSDSLEQMGRLYQEATHALKNARFIEEEIVWYADDSIWDKFEIIMNEFEERLLDVGKLETNIKNQVLADIAFFKKGGNMTSEVIKEGIIRWLHLVSFEGGIFKEDLVQLTLNTADQIRNIDNLERMLEIFGNYISNLHQERKDTKKLNKELSDAILYIKDHYCEADISLSKVALHVSLHKDYLSKLFKWELGIGFSDYINSLRIKKSKELLNTTYMRVYEVALAVGFRDESYFSRVFKKITGLRPNEYKRNKTIAKDIIDEE